MPLSPARAALQAYLDALTVPAVVVVQADGQSQVFTLSGPSTQAPAASGSVAADLRRFLEDAGHRLTLRELMDCFAAEGREVSERTVQRTLRDMHDLDNQPGAKPPGYGAALHAPDTSDPLSRVR